MDGTLVDSTEVVERHWGIWAARHGIDLAEVLRVSHGRPTLETLRLVAPHLATVEEAATLDAGEAGDSEGLRQVRGAAELLASLPLDRWAVVTSAGRALATRRLRGRIGSRPGRARDVGRRVAGKAQSNGISGSRAETWCGNPAIDCHRRCAGRHRSRPCRRRDRDWRDDDVPVVVGLRLRDCRPRRPSRHRVGRGRSATRDPCLVEAALTEQRLNGFTPVSERSGSFSYSDHPWRNVGFTNGSASGAFVARMADESH